MNFIVRKRKPPVVPIVSLIDILAILLIFFIATSTFREPKIAVDIEPPLPGTLTTRKIDEQRTQLTISAENLIYLGAREEPIAPEALAAELAAARASGVKLELKADEGADFGLILVHPDLARVHRLHRDLMRTELGEVLVEVPEKSMVSITEASEYINPDNPNVAELREGRLHPRDLPDTRLVCIYPMSKSREKPHM